MTATQFKRAVKRVEMTLNGFARFINIHPRTVRRYASGELPVPRHVEAVLSLLQNNRASAR